MKTMKMMAMTRSQIPSLRMNQMMSKETLSGSYSEKLKQWEKKNQNKFDILVNSLSAHNVN